MVDSSDLKICPNPFGKYHTLLLDNNDFVVSDTAGWRVKCCCGVSGPTCWTREDAISEWNKRPDLDNEATSPPSQQVGIINDELVKELLERAKAMSDATRMMAESKSLRQNDNPEQRTDLYSWLTPEQTVEGRAAFRITTDAALLRVKTYEISVLKENLKAVIAPTLDLSQMDGLDESSSTEMIAYYWRLQAKDARDELISLKKSISINKE